MALTPDDLADGVAPPSSEALRYQLLVEAVVDYAIYMLDPQGYVTNWNAGAQRFKGYTADEIVGQHLSRFYEPHDREAGIPKFALETALNAGRFEAEGWRVRKDGTRFWASVVIDPIRDESGHHIGFAKVTRDLTEKREAQLKLEEAREQLFQSQKMEALGQLTGGVAHDFNNLLTVIIGGAELAKRMAGDNERLMRLLEGMETSARRGAALTRQLLAFARRQPLKPEIVDVATQLTSTVELLRHTLGGGVDVVSDLEEGLQAAEVDAAQLDLVLLNLGLNGRDAMPNGGVLTLCARNVALNGEMEGLTGQFVAITVRDTGIGIASEDLARVFEPFFTTKPLGEGTGLGLSQAYGFARQSNGAIKVESAEGEGTSVTLYLPARPMSEVAVAPDPVTEESGRTGRVLVVEDDTAVSELAAELVREAGYEVVVAANADQGLKVLTANGVGFDLVFSDIMMPGEMNGLEFARAVRERFPALPILLTTGYSEAASAGPSEFPLLTKPYQLSDLLAAFERVRAETGRKSA